MLKHIIDNAGKLIFDALGGQKAHSTLNKMLKGSSYCGPVAKVIVDIAEYLFATENSSASTAAEQAQHSDTAKLLVKMLAGTESGAAANVVARLSRYGMFFHLGISCICCL